MSQTQEIANLKSSFEAKTEELDRENRQLQGCVNNQAIELQKLIELIVKLQSRLNEAGEKSGSFFAGSNASSVIEGDD